MSEAKIKVLCRMIDAFNSGDIERIVAVAHPDFEAAVAPELSAEPDVYRGHDGVRRYFGTFAEAMEDIRFQPQRIWETGDQLVVAMRMTARGKQTGIPVEQRFAQAWSIRDGLAIAINSFPSLQQALAAAGLDADSMPAAEVPQAQQAANE